MMEERTKGGRSQSSKDVRDMPHCIEKHGSREKPRSGWEQAFQGMAADGDDVLIDPETATETDWEHEGWEW